MPAPKVPNWAPGIAASVKSRRRGKHERWAAEMRDEGWGVDTPEKAAARKQFDAAVNWVVNRLDLDEVDTFQALADGLVAEDEIRELGPDEIRARLAAAAEDGGK